MSLSFLFRFSCVIFSPLFSLCLRVLFDAKTLVHDAFVHFGIVHCAVPHQPSIWEKGLHSMSTDSRQDRIGEACPFITIFHTRHFPLPLSYVASPPHDEYIFGQAGPLSTLPTSTPWSTLQLFSSSFFSSGQLCNPRCTQISTVLLSYCLMGQECITQ